MRQEETGRREECTMTDLYTDRPQGGDVRRCLRGNLIIARREADLGQGILTDDMKIQCHPEDPGQDAKHHQELRQDHQHQNHRQEVLQDGVLLFHEAEADMAAVERAVVAEVGAEADNIMKARKKKGKR